MKRYASQFLGFSLLMLIGTISVPHLANTAPPPERHPHIRAAIVELRESRDELKRAAHDFCGHRAAALEDTDRALNQLQKALACDRQ